MSMTPINETCIYCGEIIATIPIARHEQTLMGTSYTIAGNPVLTEIGRRGCSSVEAAKDNNGQHLSKTEFLIRGQ